jgi:hypothetical protein
MIPISKILLILASSFAVSGCGSSKAESTKASVQPAALYKAGLGLQLSPGARAVADLQTSDVTERAIGSDRRPAIPATALLRTVKGDFVFVANGIWFLKTPVTVAAVDADWVQIAEGLFEGDTVVSHGARVLLLAELQAVNGGVGCADGH